MTPEIYLSYEVFPSLLKKNIQLKEYQNISLYNYQSRLRV
jgi:hypothetical protein